MWYRVRLRSPETNERKAVEVDTLGEGSVRREVLRALTEARGWIVEGVERVYHDSRGGKHTLRWAAMIAGALLAAVTLVLLVSCCSGPLLRCRREQPVRTDQGLVFHARTRVDREGIPLLSLSGTSRGSGAAVRRSPGARDPLRLRGVPEGPRRRDRWWAPTVPAAPLPQRPIEAIAWRCHRVSRMSCAAWPGGRIPFTDFLYFALTPELLFYTGGTTLVVRRGGEIVQGRNLDFFRPASISRSPAIVRVAVEGKVPYVSIGFAGLPVLIPARTCAASLSA